MKPESLLEMLHIAARLKDTTRHCLTPGGRTETVAEHSWRLALMAYLVSGQYPRLDMNKVIKMCLVHDLGEAVTGDIPAFVKTEGNRQREEALLNSWVDSLPSPVGQEMGELYQQMEALQTPEAKLYKALDGLEALISHNEASLASWEPNEYSLQLTYAFDRVQFSPYLTALRQQIYQDSLEKLEQAGSGDKET